MLGPLDRPALNGRLAERLWLTVFAHRSLVYPPPPTTLGDEDKSHTGANAPTLPSQDVLGAAFQPVPGGPVR
jgi:hypothetical protein